MVMIWHGYDITYRLKGMARAVAVSLWEQATVKDTLHKTCRVYRNVGAFENLIQSSYNNYRRIVTYGSHLQQALSREIATVMLTF